MLSKERLEELAATGDFSIAPEQLTDVQEILIHGDSPCERLQNFVLQAGNPYCFRVGNMPVHISFVGTGTLEEHLRNYFSMLKNR